MRARTLVQMKSNLQSGISMIDIQKKKNRSVGVGEKESVEKEKHPLSCFNHRPCYIVRPKSFPGIAPGIVFNASFPKFLIDVHKHRLEYSNLRKTRHIEVRDLSVEFEEACLKEIKNTSSVMI